MPSAAPPPYRKRFLAGARLRHTAWLAGSGLAPRTCRTYRQQVGWYLQWLAGHPQVASALTGTPAAGWYTAREDGIAGRQLDGEAVLARQRGADEAARLYHRHLADGGAAPASVKLAMSAVGSLYGALGLLPPAFEERTTTRPYARPRTLTAAERERLLAEAASRGLRDQALVALADDAGLRPGEIIALDLADVSPAADAVRVRGGTYGHRNRVVPVTAGPARDALAAWRQERAGIQAGDPALFLTTRRHRMTLRTAEHVIRQIGAAAAVPVSPATLRNTRTAELADNGMHPYELAAWFGHANVETLRPFEPSRPALVTAPVRTALPAGPPAARESGPAPPDR